MACGLIVNFFPFLGLLGEKGEIGRGWGGGGGILIVGRGRWGDYIYHRWGGEKLSRP